MGELKKGQIWHLKINGALGVVTLKIYDLTPKTVSLGTDMFTRYPTRYELKEVKFIELAR